MAHILTSVYNILSGIAGQKMEEQVNGSLDLGAVDAVETVTTHPETTVKTQSTLSNKSTLMTHNVLVNLETSSHNTLPTISTATTHNPLTGGKNLQMLEAAGILGRKPRRRWEEPQAESLTLKTRTRHREDLKVRNDESSTFQLIR